ncbi:hypothetical protein DB313_05210 (plasmid) [Borrelia turcica IST7]|uniref:Uncharacterized protein n=1 Tax=Borrelia turcica IST7 TaxID=1104446 RepID=A0A386PNR7_9SPIR|nr:hypothetical protein [Borrelia turcica]AYE36898.1 hypothetical protein DB313_05210 [Borrelia turcica IST7]
MKRLQILILLSLVIKLNALITTKDLLKFSHVEYDNIISSRYATLYQPVDKHTYSILDKYFESLDAYYNSIYALSHATYAYEKSLLSFASIKLSLMEKFEEQYNHKIEEEHSVLHQAEEKKNLDYKHMSDLKKLCQTHKINKEKLRQELVESLNRLVHDKNKRDKSFLKAMETQNTMNNYNDTRIENAKAKDSLRQELDQMITELNSLNEKFSLSEDKLNKAYKANAVNFKTWQTMQHKKDTFFAEMEKAWNELEMSHEPWSKEKFEKNKSHYLKTVDKFETTAENRYKASKNIYDNLIAIKVAEKEYFELNLKVIDKEVLVKKGKIHLMEYK